MGIGVLWAFQIASTVGLAVGVVLNLITGAEEVKPFHLVSLALCTVVMIKFNPLFKDLIEKFKERK
ncbi:hypothetical protein BCP78_0128 [Bacillus phage BCP78]|uniref:Uncharacterized protein n=3 Tax=Tsarbombavirus BCP78 TaxID=1985182 RepID=J9PRM0_9CAUD|nr:membrane protein [Bacillus phage BCP78]YP_009783491.1 hypothetical protein QLX27_gp118 [Bacillus phage BCU4]AEW47135.1 hypothetical protein BCP78_0128 [Bacillus phage BCP78]AEW47624.1 hypothetical protein BCU4_0118 [Bacillus phage BCU4]AQN32507.1 hypothetical protein BCP12_089 [Bacillus phage BCP12]